MIVRFWGTRGSIPKPGPTTLRYGGNTSCLQVISNGGELIIIDCGSGAQNLGLHLLAENKKKRGNLRGHLLFSHTHWDHIQGAPFFTPLYIPGGKWDIYGPHGLSQSIQNALSGQMLHQYFPVSINDFGAEIHYHDLVEGEFTIGDVKIKTHYLNHTTLTLGFRLESAGISIVYSCDHEPFSRSLADGEGVVTGQDRQHVEFLKGADLVIHDAQYSVEEYPAKVGWGHSTPEYVIKVCEEAGVKHVALSHHDPLRTDEELDALHNRVQEQLAERGSPLQVSIAYEGLVIPLKNAGARLASNPQEKSEKGEEKRPSEKIEQTALSGGSVVILCQEPTILSLLVNAVEKEGIIPFVAAEKKGAIEQAEKGKPSLVLIQHEPPLIDGIEIAKIIYRSAIERSRDFPIVLISSKEYPIEIENSGVIDWLITPFTSSYARTKITSWVMRMACHWKMAEIPEDEKERIEALHNLNILDTPDEKRYDRITKIAAALAEVPMAMICFVDRNRQWFKSRHGIEIKESSRDLSFCAHVVNEKRAIIVSDTFLDGRFANNPLVTGGLRIRFYAGFPLYSRGEKIVGTLCLMDTRPRVLSDEKLSLIKDLRDMVNSELLDGCS